MAAPRKSNVHARRTLVRIHVTALERKEVGKIARRRGTTISSLMRDLLNREIRTSAPPVAVS